MEIKISVVIPTYRRPMLLKNCLQALSLQRFDVNQFEVIVVSDGPDEMSADAVNEYHPIITNLRFLSLPVKKGPAAARNYGWKSAIGELVAFTDDDCLPDKDWLNQAWLHF